MSLEALNKNNQVAEQSAFSGFRPINSIKSRIKDITTAITELKLSFFEKVALSCLKKVTVFDIGTGDAGLTRFKFSKGGYVYADVPKVEISKDKKTPQEFVNDIVAHCKMKSFAKTKIIINMTSWARRPNASESEIIRLLQEVQKVHRNITVNVLSQEEEAEVSAISLRNNLKYIDPVISSTHGITAENTIQFEGGKGSIQSASILPKQAEEMSGNWGNEQLKQGKTLEEAVEILKTKLAADMLAQMPVGIKNIALQGILAIGLQDKDVMECLKLKGDDISAWKKGRLPRAFNDVVSALQVKVAKNDEVLKQAQMQITDQFSNGLITNAAFKEQMAAAAKAHATAVPVALALASLKALQEKYGSNFAILNIKDPVELINSDGTRTLKETKTSGSHGAAVQYFTNTNKPFSIFHKMVGRVLKLADWDHTSQLIRA